jgi:hypothetical protein
MSDRSAVVVAYVAVAISATTVGVGVGFVLRGVVG